MLVLNCGCGDTPWGDVRLDLYRSSTTNVLCDLESGLPFLDNVFDKVICLNVLEHVGNPSSLILEIARVLKPGGSLRLRTDNASYWRFHLSPQLGHRMGLPMAGIHSGLYEQEVARGPEDRHYALFTLHHLRNHLENAGLHIEWLDYWPRHLRPALISRVLPLSKPFISSFLNAEARKGVSPNLPSTRQSAES